MFRIVSLAFVCDVPAKTLFPTLVQVLRKSTKNRFVSNGTLCRKESSLGLCHELLSLVTSLVVFFITSLGIFICEAKTVPNLIDVHDSLYKPMRFFFMLSRHEFIRPSDILDSKNICYKLEAGRKNQRKAGDSLF